MLFGLAHPITPTLCRAGGLIGVYFGGLLVATGNLLVPIVTHAAYDFRAICTTCFVFRGTTGRIDCTACRDARVDKADPRPNLRKPAICLTDWIFRDTLQVRQQNAAF